jgi:hypothetical protein
VLNLEALEDRTLPTLLGQTLFPADNPWNQNIANAPVAPNSTAVINNIIAEQGSDARIHPDFGQDYQNTNVLYGIPYNVVHGNSTAKVNVVIDAYPGESDIVPAPIPANAVIEGDYQDGPRPGLNNRGDSHLIIFDEDNDIAYEFYHASRPSENTDGQWHADQETVWYMNTDEFRTLGETSADAAGLSILAGLTRPEEGLPVSQGGQGAIDHAIRMTLQNSLILDQFIYPASHEANPGNTNASLLVPMGARFRLKASVNISTLNPESQIIARAMQQYGLIVADNGSNFYFSGSSFSENASGANTWTWDDNDIQDSVHGLKSLDFSDFELVDLAPVVTGLSSYAGTAGTTITVTGQNFSGAAGHLQVLFGGIPSTAITILDDSHVTALVPAGSGTVDVQVQSGVTTTSDAENFTNPIFGYGISATGADDKFTFAPTAPATHFSVSATSSTSAGNAFQFTVTALDASNFTATGFGGTVHFTSTDAMATLPADYTFKPTDLGVHTFTVTLVTPGSQSVTVADTPDGLTSLTTPITVTPGTVSLSRSSVSAGTTSLRVGQMTTVTLTARDAFGNQETSGGLNVLFSISGMAGGTFGPVTDNRNGTYTATFTATMAGSGTIKATIGGQAVTSTAPSVTVTSDVAPVIQPIAPVTLTHAQFPDMLTVSASSPVGNPLTYSVTTAGDNLLYDLQQQYQFQGIGYLTAGATAYVLHSNRAGSGSGGYYLLRPADGALFAYDGSGSYAHTFANGTPLATLGANVYTDPMLLMNAEPPIDYTTLQSLEQQYRFQGDGYLTAGATAYVFTSMAGNNSFGNPYYLLRSNGALYAYDGSGSYAHTFSNVTPTATLAATIYSNPSLLMNAVAGPALYAQLYQLTSQYDLQEYNGSFYTNTYGHQAEWIYSPVLNQYGEHWYTLTLSSNNSQAILRAWQGYQDSSVGAVIATLDPSVYSNPMLLTNATALPNPAVTASIDGSGHLSIALPSSNYSGTFKVIVTVSDGILSTSQTVSVTSTDTAPTITATQNNETVTAGSTLSFAHGSFPQTATISTADAENDAVTTTATVSSYSLAFNLQQQYRFQGMGYATMGATAYVLTSAGYNNFGNSTYLLRADGSLFAYYGSGSYAHTFANVTPIANLGANTYLDPMLLMNALPPINYTTLYNLQQQYQFTQQGAGYYMYGASAFVLHSGQAGPGVGGYYLVAPDGGLYAYDGSGSYAHTFANSANLIASLDPSVYSDPMLLLGAQAAPGLYAQLLKLEQQYDFKAVGSFTYGAPAYVLQAASNNNDGNSYYLLKSNGGLYAYDGSGSYAHTFANSANLVTTVDPSVVNNPMLLVNAKAPIAATGVTASLSNGTLTLNAPSSFVGTFQVTVGATDGILTNTVSFQVTSTDTAPAPNTIPAQTASKSGSPLQVTLGSSDAENDSISYTAAVAGYSPAYNLEQQYHFQGMGYFTTPDGTTAYVLSVAGMNANGNPYYLLKSDGALYAYDGSGSYSHTFANGANLIATLNSSYYSNPMLLTNAQAPATPPAMVSVNGNTLTVNVAAVPVGTVFQVVVTANDGAETTSTSFLVTVTA